MKQSERTPNITNPKTSNIIQLKQHKPKTAKQIAEASQANTKQPKTQNKTQNQSDIINQTKHHNQKPRNKAQTHSQPPTTKATPQTLSNQTISVSNPK